MTDFSWAYNPLDIKPTSTMVRQIQEQELEKYQEGFQSVPRTSEGAQYESTLANPTIFIDKAGKRVRGHMTALQAGAEAMAARYSRGYTSKNRAFSQYVARMALGGRDLSTWDPDGKAPLLSLNDNQEQLLTKFLGENTWNNNIFVYNELGDLPVLNNFYQTPEELFEDPAPANWNTAAALEQLELADPNLYYSLEYSLGGKERLEAVVEKARNPVEFFFKLNDAQQMQAIAQSSEEFSKEANWIEESGVFIFNFIRDGILNDPDMAGSIAITGLLALTTAGIGGAAYAGIKLAKDANKAATVIKNAKRFNNVQMGTRWVAMHLPENIGPYLMRSKFFKDSYQHMSKLQQVGVNALGNATEGLITGSLAETANQFKLVDAGIQEKVSGAAIAREGLLEMAISPLINPAIGRLYTGISTLSIGAGRLTYNAGAYFGKQLNLVTPDLGKTLSRIGKEASQNFSPEGLQRTIHVYEAKDRLKTNLSALLGEEANIGDWIDGDEMMPNLLNIIRRVTNLDDTVLLDALNTSLEAFIADPENKNITMDPMGLAVGLIGSLALDPEINAKMQQQGSDVFTGALQQFLATREIVAESKNSMEYTGEEMTPTQFAEWIVENNAEYLTMPPETKAEAKKEAGDKWDDMSHSERTKKTEDVHNRMVEEQNAELNDIAQEQVKTTEELETNTRIGASVTGTTLNPRSPGVNPAVHAQNEAKKVEEQLEKELIKITKELNEAREKNMPLSNIKARRRKVVKQLKNIRKAAKRLTTLQDQFLNAMGATKKDIELGKKIMELTNNFEAVKEQVLPQLEIEGKLLELSNRSLLLNRLFLDEEAEGTLFERRIQPYADRSKITEEDIKLLEEIKLFIEEDLKPYHDQGAKLLTPEGKLYKYIIHILDNKGKINFNDYRKNFINGLTELPKVLSKAMQSVHGETFARYKGLEDEILNLEREQRLERKKAVIAAGRQQVLELAGIATMPSVLQERKAVRLENESRKEILLRLVDEFVDEKSTTITQVDSQIDSSRLVTEKTKAAAKRQGATDEQIAEDTAKVMEENDKFAGKSIMDEEVGARVISEVIEEDTQEALGKLTDEQLDRVDELIDSHDYEADNLVIHIPIKPRVVNNGRIESSNQTERLDLGSKEEAKAAVAEAKASRKATTAETPLVTKKTRAAAKRQGATDKQIAEDIAKAEADADKFAGKSVMEEGADMPSAVAETADTQKALGKLTDEQLDRVDKLIDSHDYDADDLAIHIPVVWVSNGRIEVASRSEVLNLGSKEEAKAAVAEAKASRVEVKKKTITKMNPADPEFAAVIDDENLKKKLGNKPLKIEEVKKRISEFYENKIATLTKGLRPSIRINRAPRYYPKVRDETHKYLHNFTDDEILSVDYDYIERIESNRMDLSEVVRSPEEELRELTQWKVNLINLFRYFSNTNHKDLENGVHVFRIIASMPSYFRKISLDGSIHIFLQEALMDQENFGVDDDISTQRFDLNKVIELVSEQENKAFRATDGIKKRMAQEYGAKIEEQLRREGDPSNVNDLETALEFITKVRQALDFYYQSNARPNGPDGPVRYVLEVDEFGRATETTDSTTVYVAAVRTGITARINQLTRAKFKNKFTALLEKAKKEGSKGSTDQEVITDYIVNNLNLMNSSELDTAGYIEFTLEGFGDGTLAWGNDPGTVGGAIVDTFLGRAIPELYNLQAVDSIEASNINERSIDQGESVIVTPAGIGDLNLAAPVGLWKIARIVENARWRSRITAVLEAAREGKLTAKQKKILEKWKEDQVIPEDISPTDDQLGAFLLPQIFGHNMQEKAMTRDQQIEAITYFLSDIPQISASIIQDSITLSRGSVVRFRDTAEAPQPLSLGNMESMPKMGTMNAIPISRIGELLALESMIPNLTNYTTNMVKFADRYAKEYREKWEAANPGKEFDQSIIFDPAAYDDMSASIDSIIHTLSLAATRAPQVSDALANLEAMFIMPNGTETDFELLKLDEKGNIVVSDEARKRGFTSRAEEDYYINTGITLVSKMNEMFGENHPLRKQAGEFITVLNWLIDNGITTAIEYQNKIKELEESGNQKELAKADALREFLKIPIMRKLYGGGLPSFRSEFIGRTANSKKVIDDLNKAFGIKLSEDNIMGMGKILLNRAQNQTIVLLNSALGLQTKKLKAVRNFLSLKPDQDLTANGQNLKASWEEIVRSLNTPHGQQTTLTDSNPLTTLDIAITNLTAQLKDIAEVEGITLAQAKRKYAHAKKGLEYLNKLKKDHTELEAGSEEWATFQEIVHGKKQTWRTIGLFKALNILNSSAYKANIERITAVAEDFGLTGFNAKDWLGLENLVLYHLNLPTAASKRSYAHGADTNGIFNERAVVNPELYENFRAKMKQLEAKQGAPISRQQFLAEFNEFLSAENIDSMGMWDLKDNVMRRKEDGELKSREEIQEEIGELLDIGALLYWAQNDKLPPGMFENQLDDLGDVEVYKNVLEDMARKTEERSEGIITEQQEEEMAYRQGYHEFLRLKAKIAGGLVHPRVANDLDLPVVDFYTRERSISEIVPTSAGQLHISTVNPKGVLSMMPQTKRMSFHNIGIPVLQEIAIRRQINNILSPVQRLTNDQTLTTEEGLISEEFLGYRGPWKEESLPKPLPITIDEIADLRARDTDGSHLKAIRIITDLRVWADERGMDPTKIQGEAIPFWFVVKEMEQARYNLFLRSEEQAFEEAKGESGVDFVRQQNRLSWLSDLHNITYYSRDIKNRELSGLTIEEQSRKLALMTKASEETWINLLRNRVSEDNPYGKALSSPTKVAAALEMILPREAFLRIKRSIDSNAEIVWSELTELASIWQQTDFNYYLVSQFYNNSVFPDALKEFSIEENGKTIHPYRDMLVPELDENGVVKKDSKGKDLMIEVWKDPNSWINHIKPEHKEELIQIAQRLVNDPEKGVGNVVFDTLMIEKLETDPRGRSKAARDMYYALFPKEDVNAVGESTSLKSPFPALQAQGQSSSQVRGTGGDLVLTPARALEMLTFLENFNFYQRVQTQELLDGKAIGAVMDSSREEAINRETLSRRLRNGLGHSQTEMTKASQQTSEAILRLARGRQTRTITNDKQTLYGAHPKVVDLDHYTNFDSSYTDNFAPAWVESFIGNLSKIEHLWKTTGIDNFVRLDRRERNVLAYLEELKKNVRTEQKGQALAETIALSILIDKLSAGKDLVLTAEEIHTFFNRDLMTEEDISTGIDVATGMMRQINRGYSLYKNNPNTDVRMYPALVSLAREVFSSNDMSQKDLVAEFKELYLEKVNPSADKQFGFSRKDDTVEFENGDSALHYVLTHALGEELETLNTRRDMPDVDSLTPKQFQIIGEDLVTAVQTSESFEKAIRAIDPTGNVNSDLLRLGQQLRDMENQGLVHKNNLKLLRAMILRLHDISPDWFSDFNFEYVDAAERTAALRDEEGNVVVRLGRDLTRPYSSPDVALTFAHELFHIGKFKFVENNPGVWNQWKALWDSTAGRSLMRKHVTAWNNGKFNAAEYDAYMKNPDEYLAALGSFFMMNDILPVVDTLTVEERNINNKTMSVLGKVLNFVRNMFNRVSNVWANFYAANPELSNHVETLIQRTMGWDHKAGKGLKADKIAGAPTEMFMRMKYPQAEETFNSTDFEKKVRQFVDLREKHDNNTIGREELVEYDGLREYFSTSNEAQVQINLGQTRQEFYETKLFIEEHYMTQTGSIDVTKILNDTPQSVRGIIPREQARDSIILTATQMLMDQLKSRFGPTIQRNAGEMAATLGAGVSKLFGKESRFMEQQLAEWTTGKAGTNFTFNGPHQFVAHLTQLIDDNIGTSLGQYTNVHGLYSLNNIMNQLDLFSENILPAITGIQKITRNFVQKVADTPNLDPKARDMETKINSEMAKLFENPNHEINFDNDENLLKLNAEKIGELQDHMKTVASTMRKLLQSFEGVLRELGESREGAQIRTPLRLSTNIRDTTGSENFRVELRKIFRENLENNNLSIDALTMIEGGLLPRTDRRASLVEDLDRLEREYPGYRQFIAYELGSTLQTRSETQLTEDQLTERGEAILKGLKSDTTEISNHSLGLTRKAVIEIMKKMQRGDLTWTKIARIDNTARLRDTYMATIREGSTKIGTERLQSLSAIKEELPNYLHFSKGRTGSVQNYAYNYKTAIDVHIDNLLNRASVGMYYPNDNWIIPSIDVLVDNPAIRTQLSLEPMQIVEDMKRGTIGNLFERAMLNKYYNVEGTIGDVITLFEESMERAVDIRNDDGSVLSDTDTQDMFDSAKVLRGKYLTTKGIHLASNSPSRVERLLGDLGPGITRTIFGGNLALASFTVETMASTFQELFGRGNIMGAVRTILAPITGLTPGGVTLNSEQKAKLQRDLMHTIEALTKGYLPDYEKPSTAVQEKALTRFFNWTGKHSMRPAEHMLRVTAISRAVSFRTFVTEGFRQRNSSGKIKFVALAESIRDKPLDPNNDADIKSRLREAGFNNWMDKDLTIITYLLSNGLLDMQVQTQSGVVGQNTDGLFHAFLAEMEKTLESGDPYYSTGDMFNEIVRTMDGGSAAFQTRQAVIVGLKKAEKAFIEEIILKPNAFDVFTPGVTKGGEVQSVGALDPLFEIYRRYPMIFVGQHMMRKSNRLHIGRYAFGLMNLLMLDVLYMMLLRLAMGSRLEDIEKEFEEKPTEFMMKYLSRLPILGRYMGFVGEAVSTMYSGYGREPGGFVPVGALYAGYKGVHRAVKSQMNDAPSKWSDTVNSLRVVPIVGDRLLSLAFYTAMGDNITRRNINSSGTTRDLASRVRGSYGVPLEAVNYMWPALTSEMVREFMGGQNISWPAYEMANEPSPYRMAPMPTTPPPAVEEPTAPTPTPTLPTTPVVDRLGEQKGTSSELVERLTGGS